MLKKRISFKQWAMDIACVASCRSEDQHLKVGAVCLRKDNSIAGVGYNGAPSGIEIDWSAREDRRPKVIHAEVNALRYCYPGDVKDIVCTSLPCPACLTVIASYNIKNVIYKDVYDAKSFEIAKELKINLEKI